MGRRRRRKRRRRRRRRQNMRMRKIWSKNKMIERNRRTNWMRNWSRMRVEGGGWRVEGGGWRVEGGGWRLGLEGG
jgi:hypothetical protein